MYYVPTGAGRSDSLRAAVLAMYRSPVRSAVAKLADEAPTHEHYVPRHALLSGMCLAEYYLPTVQPLGCDAVDTPLACMRYLGSLMRIGRKHSLMSAAGGLQTAGRLLILGSPR
jgi:hypothetical protein